jgi:ABC-2 type transport system permease protein
VKSTLPVSSRREPAPAGLAAVALGAVRAGAAGALASPASLVGRGLFYVVLMLIISAFWDLAARQPAAGALAHVPAAGLALYVGATEWMVLSVAPIHLRLEDDIRSGVLESRLLRPKPHLVMAVAESYGVTLVRLAALGAVALALLWLSGRPAPPWPVIAALAILGPLGGLIGILAFAAAGATAFWARRCMAAYLVLQKASFLLGGLMAPVTLYPPLLARVAAATPFAAQIYWPARLMLEPSWRVFALAALSQLVWLALLAAAAGAIWAAGVRKLLREGA